jgi:hypothetical protein
MTDDEFRQSVYLNLLLNAWQLWREFNDMKEPEVRSIAEREIFGAKPGRDYRRRFGAARIAAAVGRRARRFNEILGEEYEAAMMEGRPPRGPNRIRQAGGRRFRGAYTVGVGAGVALGVVVGLAVRGAAVRGVRRSR